ncbi:MAG: hypothetical protein LH479_07525 [Polaromonas sp.]|nr:hypothetical protein [Polaromonas sp.]
MKASKTLTTLVAASALVGVIGLAYAQTSGTTTPMQPTTPADQTMQNQGGTMSPGTNTSPASPNAPAMNSPSADMPMERPAQADRN